MSIKNIDTLQISLTFLLLLVSCRGHQPTNIPAPDPRVETFTFDRHFVGLALDQTGTPWLRSAEQEPIGDLLSSYLPLLNSIYRFSGDSLERVYDSLPNLSSMVFDRKDRLWAISGSSLFRVDPQGTDTVYTGTGIISTLLVDIHGNVWITPEGTGILRINDQGQKLYSREANGILSNTVSCSSMDQSNTKWFGHLRSGISRITDNGTVHVIDAFTGQNLYTLAPGKALKMLAGLGWQNNDTILLSIGSGPFANLSPVLEGTEYPGTILIVTDIAVDHFNRIWVVISHVEQMATVRMELYYYDVDWNRMELLPGEPFITSLEADQRLGMVYVLTNHTLYRIR